MTFPRRLLLKKTSHLAEFSESWLLSWQQALAGPGRTACPAAHPPQHPVGPTGSHLTQGRARTATSPAPATSHSLRVWVKIVLGTTGQGTKAHSGDRLRPRADDRRVDTGALCARPHRLLPWETEVPGMIRKFHLPPGTQAHGVKVMGGGKVTLRL